MNVIKNEPSQAATCKSSIDKHPSLVYHVIKPKGNTTMIELKITANTADELTAEVQELAKQITGSAITVKQEAPAKPKKAAKAVAKEEPKAEASAKTEPAKEEPKAEEPAKEEPAKEEPPKAEEPKTDEKPKYTRDEVRAAAKAFLTKDPEKNKTLFTNFLHNQLKVQSLSAMEEKDLDRVMEFIHAQA